MVRWRVFECLTNLRRFAFVEKSKALCEESPIRVSGEELFLRSELIVMSGRHKTANSFRRRDT